MTTFEMLGQAEVALAVIDGEVIVQPRPGAANLSFIERAELILVPIIRPELEGDVVLVVKDRSGHSGVSIQVGKAFYRIRRALNKSSVPR